MSKQRFAVSPHPDDRTGDNFIFLFTVVSLYPNFVRKIIISPNFVKLGR